MVRTLALWMVGAVAFWLVGWSMMRLINPNQAVLVASFSAVLGGIIGAQYGYRLRQKDARGDRREGPDPRRRS